MMDNSSTTSQVSSCQPVTEPAILISLISLLVLPALMLLPLQTTAKYTSISLSHSPRVFVSASVKFIDTSRASYCQLITQHFTHWSKSGSGLNNKQSILAKRCDVLEKLIHNATVALSIFYIQSVFSHILQVCDSVAEDSFLLSLHILVYFIFQVLLY